jgi:hypothetical protein
MNYELLAFAIAVFFSVLTVFDITIYHIKSAPKRAMFTYWFWRMGYVSIIALIYWYMNGNKFL